MDHLHGYVLDVLAENCDVRVSGQLQSVEAGVALRVRVYCVVVDDFHVELLELSTVTLEVLKPQDRHPSVACHKMQHMGQFVLTQSRDVLPKPDDKGISCRAIGVNSVLFEILDINDLPAIDDDVQLVRLEDLQQFYRDDLIQSLFHIRQQFADTLRAVIVHPTSDIAYIRLTYSSLLLESTIISKPFSLRGMVIWVPCSSN